MAKAQAPAPAQGNRGDRQHLAAALVAVLEREQQALIAPHADGPDALEALAQQKQVLCRALQPPAYGARATEDAPTRALLARAKDLNGSNASLLAMHRSSCESRLRLLRGGDGAAATYRANGYLQF